MTKKQSPWRCHVFVLAVSAIALWFSPPARAETTGYPAIFDTSLGNPVTNIMIWETDGTSSFLDFPFELPGSGISLLSHESPFSPTRSLILGQTLGIDAGGADKTEIVMFLDPVFGADNAGERFSVAFPNTRHSVLLSNLGAAVGGDVDSIDWFENTFFPGDGMAASFSTGGSFTVAEFTATVVIGGSAVSGTWTLDSLSTTIALAVIGETAKDNGPFDLEFVIPEPNAAFEKTVVNDSGLAWTGFEMTLGTGSGDLFMASAAMDGLGFLSLSEPTGFFSDLVIEEDRLIFSNGLLPVGQSAQFNFNLEALSGVPFTIRQTAAPEPASLTLLALAGVALLRRKRVAQRPMLER